jgi:hypothetical protein
VSFFHILSPLVFTMSSFTPSLTLPRQGSEKFEERGELLR